MKSAAIFPFLVSPDLAPQQFKHQLQMPFSDRHNLAINDHSVDIDQNCDLFRGGNDGWVLAWRQTELLHLQILFVPFTQGTTSFVRARLRDLKRFALENHNLESDAISRFLRLAWLKVYGSLL